MLMGQLFISWIKYLFGINRGKKIILGQEIGPQIGEPRSILIFGYMGMGDAVMFEPTFRAYLKHFPNSNFDVVVGSSSQSLAVLQQIMDEERKSFRRIVKFDFKAANSNERNRIIKSLIETKYDACLAVYTTPLQYFISLIESIPIRIGHTIRAQEWYKPRPNFLFNIPREVKQDIDEREPYRHFRLAHAIGIQTQSELPVPQIRILDRDKVWGQK